MISTSFGASVMNSFLLAGASFLRAGVPGNRRGAHLRHLSPFVTFLKKISVDHVPICWGQLSIKAEPAAFILGPGSCYLHRTDDALKECQ